MVLYTDGASRGNPGPAGIGFVLYNDVEEKNNCLYGSYFINNTTNNVAEIISILTALYIIKKNKITKNLIIKSDSLLLVNQFKGIYKIKDQKLQLGHTLFKKNFAELTISFFHIERKYNTYADSLANRGIDEQILLPEELSIFMSSLL